MSWDFPIIDVLQVCGISCAQISRKGEARVPCPRAVKNSKGKTAMFDVNLEKNNFKCFQECEGCVSKGGMLDLYNLLMDRPFDDRKGARKEIISKLGCDVHPTQSRKKAVEEKPAAQEPKPDVEKLNKAYRMFLNALPLYDKHRQNLSKRGLSDEFISKGLYRSVPETGDRNKVLKELNKCGLFKGVPGFYTDKYGHLQIAAFASGFFVPYFNAEGKITGMQIRYDKPKEGYPKYVWFSSIGYGVDGCAAFNSAFYGIPGLSDISQSSAVYVTEGALKAAISTCLDKNHHLFVAIAGVNCYAQWEELCEHLKKKKIKIIVDAFDNDRTVNEHVERALKKLYSIAESYGIRMQHLSWDASYKGIDDFLLGVTTRKKCSKRAFIPPMQRREKNGKNNR